MAIISTVNMIELSSLCDNRCEYCPAKDQAQYRPVGLMDFEVFRKAIEWVAYFYRCGTQKELNLFGVGESTLHPRLVDMVSYARNKLPFRSLIHLNTNGNRMTEVLARQLKDSGISQIDITGHDHYATARTVKIFRKVGIQHQVSYDFALSPNDWAGQVEWFAADYNLGNCPWIYRGQAMIMSDGRVTTCCIDAFAKNVFATVNDNLSLMEIKPSKLCATCHHTIPEASRKAAQ